jgi:hypothetical protein
VGLVNVPTVFVGLPTNSQREVSVGCGAVRWDGRELITKKVMKPLDKHLANVHRIDQKEYNQLGKEIISGKQEGAPGREDELAEVEVSDYWKKMKTDELSAMDDTALSEAIVNAKRAKFVVEMDAWRDRQPDLRPWAEAKATLKIAKKFRGQRKANKEAAEMESYMAGWTEKPSMTQMLAENWDWQAAKEKFTIPASLSRNRYKWAMKISRVPKKVLEYNKMSPFYITKWNRLGQGGGCHTEDSNTQSSWPPHHYVDKSSGAWPSRAVLGYPEPKEVDPSEFVRT